MGSILAKEDSLPSVSSLFSGAFKVGIFVVNLLSVCLVPREVIQPTIVHPTIFLLDEFSVNAFLLI